MGNTLVSIIIPTYNRANLIAETLDSILAQTYKNWECLVIDDGSIDNTNLVLEEYIKRDNRFQYHQRPNIKPKGANACRNYGFGLSNGEYVIWFDDDDLMNEKLLSIQVKSLKSNNYSICQVLVFKESIENIIGLKSKHIHSNNIFEDYLQKKVILLTPSAIWRKAFLKKNKYFFDEELQAAQEWEFYCRILNTFPIYSVVPNELVYIRQHKENISSKNNHRIKLWNYFLARYKVYSNKSLSINSYIKVYLEEFMLFYFKQMVRKGFLKEAFLVFKLFILKKNNLSLKVKFSSFMAILSFGLFERADVFLKKI